MILKNSFFPELSHIDESGEVHVFVTAEGRIGAIFEVPIIDLESKDFSSSASSLDSLISALPENWTLRVIQNSSKGIPLDVETFRTNAINEIGYVTKNVFFSIEKEGRDPVSLSSLLSFIKNKTDALTHEISNFRLKIPKSELSILKAKSIKGEDLKGLFHQPNSQVSHQFDFLDFGVNCVGVIRLFKQGNQSMNESTLAALLDQIPLPVSISVSLTKSSKVATDIKLRSQLSRQSVLTDSTAAERIAETERAIQETSLFGSAHVEMEWILVLKRLKEEDLRSDLNEVLSVLKVLGDVMVETYGATPSLIAAKIGSRQHFTFTESDQVASVYLPVFSFGEDRLINEDPAPPKRSLLLHREDGSLHLYNHFNPKFLAFNALITGKSGSGKSVLANALSSSLLEDDRILLVKIDVGGSYKKECKLYGGQEVNFSLDKPSGINPFAIFRDSLGSNEAISTLTTFLSTLILEQNESSLPKLIQADIERSLKGYAETLRNSKDSSSIDHFIREISGFPRVELLKRWAKGGVFENALKEEKSNHQKTRYLYYNFENIGSASNKDFSEGVMAAVMAQVNLEMLRISKNKEVSQRMVLVCDETKFFIERNAPFFLLTTANFRKFGHGVILIAQNIKNFELKIDGQIDRGLILNSPIRFFFQADTEADYLAQQFQFDERQINSVVKNPYSGKDYREAVLQDDTGSRIIRLYLSDQEYWRMSSSKDDAEKLERLQKAVPGLTLLEAISCLSVEKR